MKTITVFTPTFNRAFCLGQLYDSLVRQASCDFLWLIIDDGSTDDTQALVASWIKEGKIEIRYVFQENQGMHGAHNTAYSLMTTKLNVCIDSDDYLPDDAIARILERWKDADRENVAGLIGLDAFKDGSIVGDKIPATVRKATLTDLYQRYKIKGDKKLVIRTSVVKEFPPYPLYPGEKLVPLGVLYLMIDQRYQWICTNDVYCIVEYLADGSSRNILRQYRKSPKGFGYSRLVEMRHSQRFTHAFTRAVHYVSSCLFQRKADFFSQNPKKAVTLLALPVGVLFHLYLLFKTRR